MEDIMINDTIEEMEVSTGSSMSPLTGAIIGSAVTLATIAAVKGVLKLIAKRKAMKEQSACRHDFVDCGDSAISAE